MCMFLYGGINEDVNISDYVKEKQSAYHFKSGSVETIKRDLKARNYEYTITHDYCDCGTFIGQANADHKEVKELAEYIESLRDMRGIKWVCIAKKWWDDDIEENQTVHIDDVDLQHFLAHIKEKCLYKIRMSIRGARRTRKHY